MSRYRSYDQKHCRWDGKAYTAEKPVDRDGFCSPACKQAHYRAYKKYVTETASRISGCQAKSVTRKKRKTGQLCGAKAPRTDTGPTKKPRKK